jgi:alginate O-acetyltransferase complex protein AlgF
MRKSSLYALFAAFSLTVAGLASAEEDLYDPAPPADAAFVRAVHASAGAGAVTPDLGGKAVASVSYGEVSTYVVVPMGQRSMALGAVAAADLNVSAGSFYTVALGSGGVVTLEDPINNNLAKALLVFYNLSDQPVSLRTADGGTTIVDAIAPGEQGHRAVNPIEVALAAWGDGGAITSFDTMQLERGAAYSVFVLGSGAEAEAVFTKNTTTTR